MFASVLKNKQHSNCKIQESSVEYSNCRVTSVVVRDRGNEAVDVGVGMFDL